MTAPRTATIPVAVRVAGVVMLVAGANAWAAAYVLAERSIYAWDWASYWLQFQELGAILRLAPASAITEISSSIARNDYNVIPILPLMPFELAFGPGRLSYILGITNAALLPSAALMAWVVERAMGQRSWARFLLCTGGVLCLHVLWAPVLRGLPDVLGVAAACSILLVYVGDRPARHRPATLVGIGLLLCLLVLTRRYYLFWAVSFFPAAVLAHLAGTPKAGLTRQDVVALLARLVLVGIAGAAFLLILAAPLVARMARTDYATVHAAYRSELAGAGMAGQVIGHFGIALLAICAGGLVWLAIRRATRELGVLLIAQALLAFGLFTRVQTLLGVQHYYLLVPAAGIGLAAAIAAVWSADWRIGWRAAGVAAVMAVVLLSSLTVFSASNVAAGPLMPRVRYGPLVRSDLGEIRRLLTALAALRPEHVYVAASSQMVNWSVFKMGCRDLQPDLCAHIADTQDIDTRDGFPVGILDADYVVLATPTQYHVRPEDQRVVGLVARDIREGRGIGVSFARVPGNFDLAQGVKLGIYRRVAPLRNEAISALGEELRRTYPQMKIELRRPVSDPPQ